MNKVLHEPQKFASGTRHILFTLNMVSLSGLPWFTSFEELSIVTVVTGTRKGYVLANVGRVALKLNLL